MRSWWYAAIATLLVFAGANVLAIAEIASVSRRCSIDLMVALCALAERDSLSAGVIATVGAIFAATLAWGAVERQIQAARDDLETQIGIENARRQREELDLRVENFDSLCGLLEIAAIHAEAKVGPIPEYVIERGAQRLRDAGAIDRRLRQALHGFITDATRYNHARTFGQMRAFYVKSRCLRGAFRTVVKALSEGSTPQFPFLTLRQVKGVDGWDTVELGWVVRLLADDEAAALSGSSDAQRD